MARSHYIYHLYRNNKRILSATVKWEILSHIHVNGWTGKEYKLCLSGDNSIGEGEVLGWRHQPRIGDSPLTIDGFCYKIIKVGDLNASGRWSVETEHFGKMSIEWREESGKFEEYERPRKSSKE